MTEKKKIKLPDDFFAAPGTVDKLLNKSEGTARLPGGTSNVLPGPMPKHSSARTKRPTTEAEAMDIILGVPRLRPQPDSRARRQASGRAAATPVKRSSRLHIVQPQQGAAAPDRPASSGSGNPFPAVLSLAFDVTFLVFRTLTLPFWLLFPGPPPGTGR